MVIDAFQEGGLCLKCEEITYEKQGEVLTDRLRDGIHKIVLRTSRRQYTAADRQVNSYIRVLGRASRGLVNKESVHTVITLRRQL